MTTLANLASSLAAQSPLARISAAQKPPKKQKAPMRRESECVQPVALTWGICQSMGLGIEGGAKRATVLAECDRAGIAYYTARTQVQAYLTACKKALEQIAAEEAKKAADATPAVQ